MENKTNNIENSKIIKTKPEDKSSTDAKESSKSIPTIIEDVKYIAMDVSGNKFEINAKEGETKSRNYDEIFLKDVVATIWLYNSETIIITSNFANYNKNNIETRPLICGSIGQQPFWKKIYGARRNLGFKSGSKIFSGNVFF